MSWAAHQFETYAIQAHLPKRWVGRVSFLGIVAGDQLPDFVAKFWTYGFTIGDTHYGADVPHEFHRGWPGAGFSHSLFFGLVMAALIWWRWRNRGFVAGFLLGIAAHCVVDINDSVGTMLLFPFSTLNFSAGTWAYAATVEGGKYLDAAAYYSSPGLLMDLFWFFVVVASWRVLTRDYWREWIVPADPKAWAWLGRRFSEPLLLAIYRATFFYGVCRMVAWTTWAHAVEDYEWDLTWGGPYWLDQVRLDSMPVAVAVGTALAVAAFAILLVRRIVDRGIELEERSQAPAPAPR
jgi:membrane-bound metal-dependent hydrolase YbcI (DUF457 family)